MDLHAAALRAAEALQRTPGRWFLAADTDADGICASAVLAIAMRRKGLQFQVRHSRQKDASAYSELAGVECDGYVLLDKGSSHLDVLADVADRTGRPVVVVDHHALPEQIPKQTVVVNPRGLQMDGSRDACASTTAFAVALALDEGNLDLAGIALAGAIGDWQHRGGWQGWNAQIIERAGAAGHVETRRVPALVGLDLADALTHTRPPTPGLHHDPEAARTFLAGLGLEGVRDVEALDADDQSRLLSAWTLQHLATGADAAVTSMLTWDALWDRRSAMGVRHLFRLVDACGRTGAAATGLAWLLGDATLEAAVDTCFGKYADRLNDAIHRLRKEGTTTHEACQVMWTDDPALTGMVGGIGMTHVLDDTVRPAVILAKRPDGDVQISTRGTHEAVEAGLDLGSAVAQAARAVGRDGGGHPVAAGTVVHASDVDAFVSALDAALRSQAFIDGAATTV